MLNFIGILHLLICAVDHRRAELCIHLLRNSLTTMWVTYAVLIVSVNWLYGAVYVNCFFSMQVIYEFPSTSEHWPVVLFRMNASIYFETSRNSNSTVMHILPYFNDESGSAEPSLACDATSSSSRSGAVRTIIMPADLPPKPTINEVGFPLFPLEPKPEVSSIKALPHRFRVWIFTI